MRKPVLIAVATLLLLGLGAWVIAAWRVVAWVGHASLEVTVLVLDAETGQPIANAQVDVFDGPHTPVEGLGLNLSLDSEAIAQDAKRFSTDERGSCEFQYPFWAHGTKGLVSESGSITVSGVWLRITAPDGRRVFVPIDQQAAKPRPLNDRSPIFVTVVFDQPLTP